MSNDTKAKSVEESDISFFNSLDIMAGSAEMVKRAIRFSIQSGSRIPIGIFGRAGIGKTKVVEQIAEELNMDLQILFLAHMDKEDLAGFPFPHPTDESAVVMRLKKSLPREKSKRNGTILFLDEWNRGERPVVNAMFTIMEHRMVGDAVLPDDVHIVLSGNPSDAQYMVNEAEKEPAIRRRVAWCGMITNHAAFLKHATEKKFHSSVLNYVRSHKSYLYDTEGHNAGRVCANPASWEKVSKVVYAAEALLPKGKELDDMDVELRTTIAGLIGKARMTDFMTVLMNEDAQHVDPEEILLGEFRPGTEVYQKVERLVKSKKSGSSGKIGDLCSALAVTVATTTPAPASAAPAIAKFANLLEGDNLQKFFENLLKSVKEQDPESKYLNPLTKALGEQPEYKAALKRLWDKASLVTEKINAKQK